MSFEFEFEQLERADLKVDAVYKGGSYGDVRDDPIGKILPCVNLGGFRYNRVGANYGFVVLYSSLAEPDWPDSLDRRTGRFVYYGDNRKSGCELHDTKRGGNVILRDTFSWSRNDEERKKVPPFFVFTKTGVGRNVRFRGIAVPGALALRPEESLSALWRFDENGRFQNYQAVFTILDEPVIKREFIDDVLAGNPHSSNSPKNWLEWIEKRKYNPLIAEAIHIHRKKEEQLPKHGTEHMLMLQEIIAFFEKDPYAFESCAKLIAQYMDSRITKIDLTRPYRDGGRDALGEYSIGHGEDDITVDFALEAKCYSIDNGVGVKDTSRLISRLRHRQFGIFVTTSYVSKQAYEEIRKDDHPVVILSGADIIRILEKVGVNTKKQVSKWLSDNFKKPG